MAKLGTELGAVQNPLIQYAAQVGWTYLAPEDALTQRGGEDGLLLQAVFLSQAQRLNPGVVDLACAEELAKRVNRAAPRIEGNLETWEFLRGLKTVFVPVEKRERNLRLLAANWEENVYHITPELRFSNGTHRIRLDVAFYVNGIPVLLVETKSATKSDGIAEALDQVRRYHKEGPELLALIQVHSLTHLVQYYYGPTWNVSHKALFNWRDEAAGQDFETLVKTFVHPQRLTRLISDFILFTRKDDELSKIILRPHQMRAVERIVRRADNPEARRGLIWHTQGSGKTYTMIVAAKQLLQNPIFENPTVLMLVDRNELEAQLYGNLEAVGFGHVEVARSKRHLQELLGGDRRGLIVSMIHKFEDVPANLNTRQNIFVLVDEAHRTTGGDLGNYLMAALPNATYLGFTGTPIDQTAYGKGTFIVFGRDDPKGYLDKYSIAESIHDKTTVPLRYSLAPSDLLVDRPTLEKEFLNLVEAEGLTDVEALNRVLEKAVTLRNMLKNRERMDRVAQHVAEHYRSTVEPMGYKAFLVAVDREACALYKDLLDRYLPPEYSQVVYSPAHNDSEDLQRFYLDELAEQRVRKAFRKPDSLPKILIVTEKLLTGFDAPVLYCMYLDKPMRDHVLLQAIARVNRPYEDEQRRSKPAGFVLDYVGVFERLEKALAFDSEDVAEIQRVVTDLALLRTDFQTRMGRARQEFMPITQGAAGDKAAEKALTHFRDEAVRQEFYQFFRELADLYEIISPDAFLYPYIQDYDHLSRLYRLLRSAYDSVFVDHELTRKTARLVQEHTHGGAIQDTLAVYEINDGLLERLAQDDTPETVKVFNLLKSIQTLAGAQGQAAPYLLSIGERAEAIAQAYQLGTQAAHDALEALQELIREINQAEGERQVLKLLPETFAVYWLLKREGLPEPEQTARQIEKVFGEHPHWGLSEAQRREVRIALYGVLLEETIQARKEGRAMKETRSVTILVEQILRAAGQIGDAA